MAKKILLNEFEFAAMEGLSHLAIVIYIKAIRPYMDYATGITGWKRGISYQSISEEVYVEPVAGRHSSKSGSYTKSAIRNALKELIKSGFIQVLPAGKKLVLKLILAITDLSVQNRNDTGTTQGSDTPPIDPNPALLKELQELKQAMNDIAKHHRNDTPPVSGETISITTTTKDLKTDIPNQNGGGGGCDFNNLIFDKKLSDREIKAIKKALPTDNQEDAQALIDELAGAMATKEVKSKVSYFNALVKSFKAGEFIPMAGIEVSERRERVVIEKQEAIENRKQKVKQKENRTSKTTTAGRAAMKALTSKGVKI
jgi:hypothetical protein